MLIKEYTLRVSEDLEELVTTVVQKLGAEVEPMDGNVTAEHKKAGSKKGKKHSALNLFGTWKDVEIDPDNFRKQLWDRSQKL